MPNQCILKYSDGSVLYLFKGHGMDTSFAVLERFICMQKEKAN